MNETTTKPGTANDKPNAPSQNTGLRRSFGVALFGLRRWWLRDVVAGIDQVDVIEKRREEGALSHRYLFMTAMSAGIAILGLLLGSPAVVIGAMLLSPLMDPIMGLGFALAIGDYRWLKQSARTLAWGSVLAVLLCALLVFFSPIQTITSEIAARTRPNLFDLFVALFSALAGAYAMIRGREGTIVGVAIATALMPPLATIGFGLATLNWTVFSGALLLFATNFLTIALTAWAMARIYGFSDELSKGQGRAQNIIVAVVFFGLAIPLGFSLQQIAWEANAQRIVRSEIQDVFDDHSVIDTFEIEFNANPMVISATMLTPLIRTDAEAVLERAITRRVGRDVDLSLTQFQVGTSATSAQQAQLSAARAREEADARERSDALAMRLSLAAGTPQSDVLIDRTRKRALVRASRLAGANLATYRELELRVAATEPDWKIEFVPPLLPLPRNIAYDGDGLTVDGFENVEVIGWAARRLAQPVELAGNADAAEIAAGLLRREGVEVEIRRGSGTLSAAWGGVGGVTR